MPNRYKLGNVVRVFTQFTDITGVGVNPETVALWYRDPLGNETTVEEDNLPTGASGYYYYDISANEVGTWYYAWIATGVNQAEDEKSFIVDQSPRHIVGTGPAQTVDQSSGGGPL